MKKTRWMKRVISLTAAVTLLAQTMTVMAFGAPTGKTLATNTPTSGTAGKTDVFYCPAGVTGATISGFEPALDYIAYDGALTPTADADIQMMSGEVTVVTLTATTGTIRVIPADKPVILSAAPNKPSVEQGEPITLTANALYGKANSPSGETVTLQTGAMAVGPNKHPMTVKNGSETATMEVSFEVTACPLTGRTPTIAVSGDQAGMKFSAAVDYGAACAIPAHMPPKTVSWTATANPEIPGLGIDPANGKLTIPTGLTPGTYTITGTATVTNTAVTASAQLTYTEKAPDPVCNRTIESVTVTPRNSLPENKLTLKAGEAGAVSYDAALKFHVGDCTTPGHNETFHGTTYTYQWSLTNAPAGVTIDPQNGIVSIAATAPAASGIVVTAAANGNTKAENAPATGTANLSLVREAAPPPPVVPPTCPYANAILNSITLAPSGNTITVGDNATVAATYTPTLIWNVGTPVCLDPAHVGDLTHGRPITWTVQEKGTAGAIPTGITIAPSGTPAGATATVTVTNNSATKLAKPLTNITITALMNGVAVASVDSTVTRPVVCTRALSGTLGLPQHGQPTGTNNKLEYYTQSGTNYSRLVVNDAAATLTFTAAANFAPVGGCEYETHSIGAALCPNYDNHRVRWSLNGTYSGVSIHPDTGVLTVDRPRLTRVETVVGVVATVGGKNGVGVTTSTGYLTVRNGQYSSSDDDDDDNEQSHNEEQWDSVEYKIEDADSKDVISVSLGSNSKMPFNVVETLRGRNVTLEMSVEGGYTWIVNGKSLKALPKYQLYIPLGIKRNNDKDVIRAAKEYDIAAFDLNHSGSFYGTYYLQRRLDSDYEGKYVYLYKYNKDSSKMTYKGSAKVDADGFVKFPFTSASTYVITSRALYGEKAGSTGTGSTATAGTGGTGGTGTGGTGGTGGGAVTPPPSPSSSSVAPSSSSSESSSVSSEIPSSSSSTSEISMPTETKPEEEEKPKEKKSIPIIVPILLVVVTLTVVAVVLLAKGGGMHIGG